MTTSRSAFRVWGRIDGVAFDQVFSDVREWRAERKLIEPQAAVTVLGMATVDA